MRNQIDLRTRRSAMASHLQPLPLPRSIVIAAFVLSLFYHLSSANQSKAEIGGAGHRSLLGFKETPEGGNTTFECSPSGPCIPCQYSEKTEEKYRCSETGYRIPLKCVKVPKEAKQAKSEKQQKRRSTLGVELEEENPPANNHDEQASDSVRDRALQENKANKPAAAEGYVTYRSCIPAVNEEKLSVLGFEVFMLGLLLISGSVILLKRRKTSVMPGAGGVRMQTNPRF